MVVVMLIGTTRYAAYRILDGAATVVHAVYEAFFFKGVQGSVYRHTIKLRTEGVFDVAMGQRVIVLEVEFEDLGTRRGLAQVKSLEEVFYAGLVGHSVQS